MRLAELKQRSGQDDHDFPILERANAKKWLVITAYGSYSSDTAYPTIVEHPCIPMQYYWHIELQFFNRNNTVLIEASGHAANCTFGKTYNHKGGELFLRGDFLENELNQG